MISQEDREAVYAELGILPLEEPLSNGHKPEPAPLPAFPLEVLPPDIRAFVEAACVSVCVAPEMLAPMVLASAGAMIGRARTCGIKEDWQEVPALWTLAVAEPGARKSPAFRRAMAGPMAVQGDLRQSYKLAKAAWEEMMPGPQKDREKPTRQQVVVDDITIEALGRVLAAHPRGVVLSNDELGGWAKGMGQYKPAANSDRQKWLSLWSGKSIVTNRVRDEEPIEIDDPCVGILGATQPDALPDFLRMGVQDGMLHRFLLSCPPDVEEDPDTPSVPLELKVGWLTACRRLHGLEGQRPIEVTPDGLEALRNELRAIYAAKRACDPVAVGFWAKADAYLLRLAAVVCELWHVAAGGPEEIGEGVAATAALVLRFHLAHAEHLVVGRGLLESRDYERANPAKERELAAWLKTRPGRVATKREATHQGPLRRMETREISVVLSSMVARGELEVRSGARDSVVISLLEV